MSSYVLKPVNRLLVLDAIVTSLDVIRPKGYCFDGEMHDFWELLFVVEGTVTATADERVYNLKKGNLLFHKPMEYHRLYIPQSADAHLLIISFKAHGAALRDFYDKMLWLSASQADEFGRVALAFRRQEELFHKADSSLAYALAGSEAAARLESFLLSLTQSHTAGASSDSYYAELYAQVVNYMNNHLAERLSLDRIAEDCSLGRSNLKRIFRMFCDRGVMSYFNSLKIRRAIVLLEQGCTANEVCARLGYENPSTFFVAFKRETGTTPRKYTASGNRL